MSKCSVCDMHGASFSHNESMYHMECYYECYHYGEYDQGYQSARNEIDFHGMDVENMLALFRRDPADNAFQYGYHRACVHEFEKQNGE